MRLSDLKSPLVCVLGLVNIPTPPRKRAQDYQPTFILSDRSHLNAC
jgi:hypothetical protein